MSENYSKKKYPVINHVCHLQSKELEGDHGHQTGDTHAKGRSAGSHGDDGGGSGAAGAGAAAGDRSTGGLGNTRWVLVARLLLSRLVVTGLVATGLVATGLLLARLLLAGLVAAGGLTLAAVGLGLRSESSGASVGLESGGRDDDSAVDGAGGLKSGGLALVDDDDAVLAAALVVTAAVGRRRGDLVGRLDDLDSLVIGHSDDGGGPRSDLGGDLADGAVVDVRWASGDGVDLGGVNGLDLILGSRSGGRLVLLASLSDGADGSVQRNGLGDHVDTAGAVGDIGRALGDRVDGGGVNSAGGQADGVSGSLSDGGLGGDGRVPAASVREARDRRRGAGLGLGG